VVSGLLEVRGGLPACQGVCEQAKRYKFPVRNANFLADDFRIRESGLVSSVCYLSGNNLRQVVLTHATKQYKLVPISYMARKVTVGLALRHMLSGLKKEDEHSAAAYTPLKTMIHFTFYHINLFNCCMHEL